MKQYSVTALGLLLSGCAVQGNHIPEVPADDVVDQLMAVNIQKVSLVQQQLIAALTPVLPALPQQPRPSSALLTGKTATPPPAGPDTATATATAAVPSSRLPALTYVGRQQDLPALAVSGKAPTLHQALARIVPDTWSIHFDMGLKPEVKRPLTWIGNDQWPYVLNRILVQEKLHAEINWSAQKVSVSDAGTTPTSSTSPSVTSASAAKSASDKPAGKNPFTGGRTKSGTTAAAATGPGVQAAMTPPTVWRAIPGVTLKDTLLDWTTREKCPAGGTWKLAWNTSVSYRIDAPLAFSGSFREALNQLFILYGAAFTPLYAATQSVQCVLLVDDREPR
ncbi:hypothetical protein GTD56_004494 [Salmonella enterica subsp. diarizonae]|nr:hypothetical protein [Salmonella enterica subsp. diarizonae]EIO3282814.1 toxin co-regulated pilus biosynthesis Q family protein [Salmonella enterica]